MPQISFLNTNYPCFCTDLYRLSVLSLSAITFLVVVDWRRQTLNGKKKQFVLRSLEAALPLQTLLVLYQINVYSYTSLTIIV